MDERRVKTLIRDLRATGRLFNPAGAQYWDTRKKEEKDIRW